MPHYAMHVCELLVTAESSLSGDEISVKPHVQLSTTSDQCLRDSRGKGC